MSAAVLDNASAHDISFRLLAESIPQIVFTAGPDGGVEYLNGRALTYTGLAAEALTGEKWAGVIHPDDLPGMLGLWTRAIETGEPFEIEVRMRRADGAYLWHMNRAVPQLGADGKVARWFGTCTDIDLQKRHEAELQRMSQLLSAVSNATSDAIFVKDLEGRYLYVNPACAALIRRPVAEILGTRDRDHFGAKESEAIEAYDASILAGGVARTYEEEVFPRDGHPQIFSTTKAPYRNESGEVVGIVGIARNVTATKAEARVVKAERDRFATIAAVVPGVINSYRMTADGHVSFPYASPQIVDIYGMTPEALAEDASAVKDLYDPDDVPRIVEARMASARDLTPFHLEARVKHPTRGEIWIETRSTPTRQDDGSVLWHGFIADITARRRAEEELRAERDRLSQIAAASPGVMHSFRIDGRGHAFYPYAAPQIESIFGVTADDLAADASRGHARIHPDDLPHVAAEGRHSAETLARFRSEYRVLHPTKGEIWVEANSRPQRTPDGGTLWNGVLTDVTERKRSEERLRASEATLRSILETAPDIMMSLDRDRNIRFINRLAPGYRMEDVVGRSAYDFISPDTLEQAGCDGQGLRYRRVRALRSLRARSGRHRVVPQSGRPRAGGRQGHRRHPLRHRHHGPKARRRRGPRERSALPVARRRAPRRRVRRQGRRDQVLQSRHGRVPRCRQRRRGRRTTGALLLPPLGP